MHKRKLQFFCRICGEFGLNQKLLSKGVVEEFAHEYYKIDFKEDDESKHSDKVCTTCYHKLRSWKEKKSKFDKHKKRNLANNLQFDLKTNLPDSLVSLPCSPIGDCRVCNLEINDPNDNIEPSPSKYQKLSATPMVSPSDALKKSGTKSNAPGKARKSILIEKTESQMQADGEKELVKIYVSENVFDVNQSVDTEVALLFVCSVCSHVPKDPYKIAGCEHICCFNCVLDYKSKTNSSKCPFQDCKQLYNENQILPISGRDRSLYNTLRMNCANNYCKFQCNINQIEEHSKNCRKRGAYTYKNAFLRGKRSQFVEEKLGNLKQKISETCKESKLDITDTLFYLLRDNLREKGAALSCNVDKLYEYYAAGVENIDDYLPEKPNAFRSAALKSYANLTVGQYKKIEEFEKGEASKDSATKLAPYKAMLKAEKECDVGNSDYKLVDKENDNVVKTHTSTLDDPCISISEDVGCLPPGLLNIPVDGSRVSLVDSVAHVLSQKYPEMLQMVFKQFPGLWLPDYTLRVHVKVAWDGTLGKSRTQKGREREEVDHWLSGCIGVLQIDIEWGDGKRSVLWTEQSPNSILSCIPVGLYKGEEGNRATLSYIMNAVDSELDVLKNCFIELETKATIPTHTIESHLRSQDEMEGSSVDANENLAQPAVESMEAEETLETAAPLKYDDVVREEFLMKFCEVHPNVVRSDEVQQANIKQRFNVRVTNPKDEKFDRNVRGKAGAGSNRPCVHCSLNLTDCMCAQYFGTLPIELTNTLEKEAVDFCLDNPLDYSRKELDGVSFGMKRMRLTSSEVTSDVTDALHLHINVSGSFLFKIGCRIFCFGADQNPVFHWEKTAGVKEKIEQAEAKYAKKLQSVISSLPSLTQMPGNFGRTFIDKENRGAVLDPLPDCPEKRIFSEILDLWEKMCNTHCKTSPTPEDRLDYDRLAREIQTKVGSLKWIKRWPNQFIRACHHNGVFLNDPEGTGSIGPHSTEPLESGNHWIKLYDDGHTYRGDRDLALKGVFKLRRMKSSAKLQQFYPKVVKEIQKCSVCKQAGHNMRSAACTGPPPLMEGVEDFVVENHPVETEEVVGEEDIGDEVFDEGVAGEADADLSMNYFVFHFVDETLIEDDDE